MFHLKGISIMTTRALIASKITIPQIPDGVLITDGIKRLCIDEHSLVSIVAPAGYGKTTSILAGLRHSSRVHWYRLEKEDKRLPIFYAHLIATLFKSGKKAEPESARFLRSLADLEYGYDLLNASICQDWWSWYGEKTRNRHFLVLDDFHNVRDNEKILETIRYFAANFPDNMHIIISSRIETGVFDGSIGLEKDIHFISEKELSFSEEDINLYTGQIRGLALSKDMLHKLFLNTEGWISGIVLLCNLMCRDRPADIEGYWGSNPERNEIFKYFLTEGLQSLDQSNLEALAIAATLDEFSISDLETAFGLGQAATIIDYCEEVNLFIQKTVSDTIIYRFHSLFRNALLNMRAKFFNAEEISELHIKASNYYLSRQDYVRAIRHMLLSRRMQAAINLLCTSGKDLLFTGRGEHLKMLLEELPLHLIKSNAYLSFYYGFTLISSEFDRSYAFLQNAISLFEEQGNTDMQAQAMAVLFTVFAQRNDIAMIRNLVADCERLDIQIKSDEVRGSLLACRLGRAAFDEDFTEGLLISQEINKYQLNDLWRLGINNFRCMIHYRLGELDKGRRIVEENFSMPLVKSNDQYKILNLVFAHTIAIYMNDSAWSAWIRNELLNLGKKYNSGYALGFGKKDAALARYIAHDIDSALELMNASARYFRDYQNHAQVHRSTLFQNLWLLEKSPDLVNLEDVMESCEYLVNAAAGQGFAETAESFAGIILRESGQYEKAEDLLRRSFNTSKQKKTLQTMAGTAMHLAKLYYDLKDHSRADEFLKIFISISFKNNFVIYYDLFFPTLIEIAARCVLKGMHGDYALQLISRYFGNAASRYLAENPARLCRREEIIDFMMRFKEGLDGRKTIRISMLGDFKVQIGDRFIEESEWKTRKAQRILKYLVLKRDHFVSKEALAELFWPGTNRKAAMASLNVALYELRRVLANYGSAPEDEFPLLYDRIDGFEVKSSARLMVDFDDFSKQYSLYKLYDSEGGNIISPLKEMVRLYSGNLLPQDLYEDWTLLEREHLKSKFLEAAHRFVDSGVQQNSVDEAEAVLIKILNIDPYDESAFSKLLDLYNKTGRQAMASNLRQAFKKGLYQ